MEEYTPKQVMQFFGVLVLLHGQLVGQGIDIQELDIDGARDKTKEAINSL